MIFYQRLAQNVIVENARKRFLKNYKRFAQQENFRFLNILPHGNYNKIMAKH